MFFFINSVRNGLNPGLGLNKLHFQFFQPLNFVHKLLPVLDLPLNNLGHGLGEFGLGLQVTAKLQMLWPDLQLLGRFTRAVSFKQFGRYSYR